MDAITLMMALFLNLNEPCTALPAAGQSFQGQSYQLLRYDCGDKLFQIWQRWCAVPSPPPAVGEGQGGGFWGRPFFLEEINSQQGFYLDRFAEVHNGWHVRLDETYVPQCGV